MIIIKQQILLKLDENKSAIFFTRINVKRILKDFCPKSLFEA